MIKSDDADFDTAVTVRFTAGALAQLRTVLWIKSANGERGPIELLAYQVVKAADNGDAEVKIKRART